MEEMRSLEDLLDLQKVDSDIDRLLDRRSSLVELDEFRTAHEEVAALEEKMGEAAGEAKNLDLSSDKESGELGIDEVKAEREEQRLYAGGLTARDAEYLRAEVEMLRRRISERESSVLDLMEQRDQAQGRHDDLAAERDAADARKQGLESGIKKEWAVIDGDVAALEERKAAIVPLIDEELLDLYEEIRPSREGVAAARLAERVCGGCHLSLSAAEESRALKENPPRCRHCQRILVPQ